MLKEEWQPSKYTIADGSIHPSRNRRELSPSSRIIASLVAGFYTDAIPRWASGDLADLGCGKAPLMGSYAKYCTSSLLVDWENSAHPNSLLDISQDLNDPLTSIKSESLDTVLLSDVLEHIREPAKLLVEISRILRPGGYLILNVPFAYRLHEQPYDYYRFTSYALEYLVNKAGLRVIELRALGGWLEVMGDMWSKLFSAVNLWWLSILVGRGTNAVGRTPVGRRVADKTGSVLPLGYGLVAQKPKTA